MKSYHETMEDNKQVQKAIPGQGQLMKLTSDHFLKDFSVVAVQKKCREINTPAQIFNADLPAISSIKKAYGADFTQAYIETWIVNVCEFLNIGKNMNPNQIYDTAELIAEDFHYLTVADINLVFKRAKLGRYGQIFDRLDGQVILGWFRSYDHERTAEAEQESINEANRYRGRDNRTGTSEPVPIKSIQQPRRSKS